MHFWEERRSKVRQGQEEEGSGSSPPSLSLQSAQEILEHTENTNYSAALKVIKHWQWQRLHTKFYGGLSKRMNLLPWLYTSALYLKPLACQGASNKYCKQRKHQNFQRETCLLPSHLFI